MKPRQESFPLLLALAFLLLLSSAMAHAQVTTADLVGTIKDSSGAVVPGAKVVITNQGTGVSRSTTTGADGNYIFTSLPPGTYTLAAEATGFIRVERTGVQLQVNQRAQVDLALAVGRGETVVIEGTAPLLETQSSVLGSVIQERQVQDLPLNGRNFVQLATLAPGVSGAGSGMRGTIMSGTRPDDLRPGTELFVNGNRENSNNYLYDGIDNNTRLTLVIVMRPNVEAIKEFKVQTNLFSAEQGLAIPADRSTSSPSPAATRFTARPTGSCATTGSTPTTSFPTAPGRRNRRSSSISSAAPWGGRSSRTRPSSSPITTGSDRSWGASSSTPCRP